ncbi:MAG TPA: peptide deformylase [Longimicrobiales bacterium]
MAVREIRILGDPVLRQKAEPVVEVDDEVRRLIADMFETMYDADGVGLAAPQVGVSLRVIVVDPRDESVPPFALVNPEIVERAEEVERGEEGCLSIPGLREIVERSARVVVEGLDRDGLPRRIEAEGLVARILQHEIDHLDGILFIDRLSPLKRQMLLRRWQKVKPGA